MNMRKFVWWHEHNFEAYKCNDRSASIIAMNITNHTWANLVHACVRSVSVCKYIHYYCCFLEQETLLALLSTRLFIWIPDVTEKATYPAVLMGQTVHLFHVTGKDWMRLCAPTPLPVRHITACTSPEDLPEH